MLQKCVGCGEIIDLQTPPQDLTAYPLLHTLPDGSGLSLNHPIHLGCIEGIDSVTKRCQFCHESLDFSYIQLRAPKEGESRTDLELRELTQELWSQVAEAATTCKPRKKPRSALSSLLEGSLMPTEEKRASGRVDGQRFENIRELVLITALRSARWRALEQLITDDSVLKKISPDYVKQAWQAAAALGDIKLLRTISYHRPDAVRLLSRKDRISAWATCRPLLDDYLIAEEILPLEEPLIGSELTSIELAEQHRTRQERRTALAMQQMERSAELQLWLNNRAISGDIFTLRYLLENPTPITAAVRGEFVVALIASDDLSLDLLKKTLMPSCLPILDATSAQCAPSKGEFAPIPRDRMVDALWHAVHKQELEVVEFLITGLYPLTAQEWDFIYQREAKRYGGSLPIIKLLEATHPHHPRARHIDLLENITPPRARFTITSSSWMHRFKKWRRSFIGRIGRWVAKRWKKLCSCFR